MDGLRRDLLARQAELAKLLETFGENYDGVVDARAQIAEAELATDSEAARYARTLTARRATLGREDAALQSSVETARAGLAEARETDSRLSALQATADKEQALLDDLDRQRQDIAGRGALPASALEVMSPASVPIAPLGKSKILYLAFAMIFAGGAAVTAAFAREMMDRGLRSAEQFDGVPGSVAVGLVPRLSRRDARAPGELLLSERGGMFADSLRGILSHSSGWPGAACRAAFS